MPVFHSKYSCYPVSFPVMNVIQIYTSYCCPGRYPSPHNYLFSKGTMAQMVDNKNTILISNYNRYVGIANEACDNAQKSAVLRSSLVREKDIDHQKMIKDARDVHDNASIAIVFSVMAIEAFINEYGVSNFSSNFFKNHLDNLNLISKLIIIPKLAKNIELDKTGQVYQEVKWLIDFRNNLVHFRPKKRSIEDIDMTDPMSQKDFVMESHAKRSVKAMSMLIEILNTGYRNDRNI